VIGRETPQRGRKIAISIRLAEPCYTLRSMT
jgi:hypothetical protein